MTVSPFRAVERTSAAEAVRDQVVGLIERGELRVGERLPSEKELARSLSVSRTVVREALGGLRAIGMITSQPGRGSFVASDRATQPLLLGRCTPTELHEVRLHLEVRGAGLAAERCSPESATQLRELVEAMEAERNPRTWVRLDAEFHVTLAEATQNGLQAQLVEGLRELHVELSTAAIERDGRRAEAEREHRAICEAVCAREELAAEQAMREHIVNGCRIWTALAERTDMPQTVGREAETR